MEENKDQVKKKTWGNVEPGPLTDGEAASLGQMKANAAQCHIKPTNMDPEPKEGGTGHSYEHRPLHWQQLSDEEKEFFSQRKDGHPKNRSGKSLNS